VSFRQLVLADGASIESAKAQILADKANIDNIKLQLAYTTIYSPIDGRTGNVTVKGGNIVTPNTTVLTTITQVEPIYVTFAVPEARLADVRRYMAQGTLQVEARGQDGTDSDQGQLTFVDNNVDTTTGTIRLIDGPNGLLMRYSSRRENLGEIGIGALVSQIRLWILSEHQLKRVLAVLALQKKFIE
jgi:multidrug efflux pump subunit AcrA (membrane-fusion protein)